MILYRMTATFGKLENQTLELKPGLNVIAAPNEWGKSTWCAFLTAMLYGVDTRAKTTRTALADKEHYLPWSGSPMAGRIDLNWKDRDITIERRTKGRSVFGDFRAYETKTGLPVPELQAADCGQTLLGVEKSVFLRAGFLRLADLPVTQDDALRRRLNALVTTGDESAAGDLLGRKLKELKNRCRYNRTGLLPQAEQERAALTERLETLDALQRRTEQLHQRQQELENRAADLANHRQALAYAAARADADRVARAEEAEQAAADRLAAAEAECRDLPELAEADAQVAQILELSKRWEALQAEREVLPPLPAAPETLPCFDGLTPEQAEDRVRQDAARLPTPAAGPKTGWLTATGALIAAAAGALLLGRMPGAGIGLLALAAVLAVMTALLTVRDRRRRRREDAVRAELQSRYGSLSPADWQAAAQAYGTGRKAYEQAYRAAQERRDALDRKTADLKQEIGAKAGPAGLQERLVDWMKVQRSRQALEEARRVLLQAKANAASARAMAQTAEMPLRPDELTLSLPETLRQLEETDAARQQLQSTLGQCQGRAAALGSRETLEDDLRRVTERIAALEKVNAALELAQTTLTESAQELQRRFAPCIAEKAQSLFARLTGGRYDRLTLQEDLSLLAGTRDETTVRAAQWRSDGTVDQLYLALRLAVAEALTPEAPFVLDDALVRFDDERLGRALALLRELGEKRQILLFSCQEREKRLLEKMV